MRMPRQIKQNAAYHVTARANRGEMVLFCPAMRKLFLAILERAKKKYGFAIHNFSIMGNHIHLLIRPGPKGSLSQIMQWILSLFARAWNKKHGVKGHVWGDRFFSKILAALSDFLHAFAYVSRNPVKAGLVETAEAWEFGGLWHFIKGNWAILGQTLCIEILYQSLCLAPGLIGLSKGNTYCDCFS
ncbi:MAG: transposase [Treponema sp.]|jgi:putative transposase|nr:transposase [Treponema sp.]